MGAQWKYENHQVIYGVVYIMQQQTPPLPTMYGDWGLWLYKLVCCIKHVKTTCFCFNSCMEVSSENTVD